MVDLGRKAQHNPMAVGISVFAAAMLMMSGLAQALAGVAALIDDAFLVRVGNYADQARAILREVDGFGDCGLRCPHMGELLCLGLGTLGLAPQHQPGGSTRRQRLAQRLGNHWQGSARAAVPGGRPWACRTRRAEAATTP